MLVLYIVCYTHDKKTVQGLLFGDERRDCALFNNEVLGVCDAFY